MVKYQNPIIPERLFALHDSLSTAWNGLCRVHAMHQRNDAKKGLLIYGKSGEGKSYLASQYLAQFPPVETPEKIILPVFYYRFKEAKKSTDDILKLLIRALGTTPPKGKTEPGELHEQFTTLVTSLGVELIILDEIQQILPSTDGITALNTLKYFCALLDGLDASIAFIGSDRAMKLLSFGKSDKTMEDNEQLSRRMLRPISLERIEPRTQEWIDCVNWFLDHINFPPLTLEDKVLFDRIYIAYLERSFSTLESLFLLENMSNIKSSSSLLMKLKTNFNIYGKADINPFSEKQLSDDDVDMVINNVLQKESMHNAAICH